MGIASVERRLPAGPGLPIYRSEIGRKQVLRHVLTGLSVSSERE
jgi:hypothetical protein